MKTKNILMIMLFSLIATGIRAQSEPITFHYLGHSAFLILVNDETSVLTDYGKPNAYLEYGWNSPIYDIGDFQPAICTYSHAHDDHYDSTRISGDRCVVLNTADTLIYKDLTIYPVLTSEKNIAVKDNRSYLIVYKGIRILHLGDCQANIFDVDSLENQKFIKENIPLDCDVVLLPIESTRKFIPQLKTFIEIIRPKTIIPMHYWSDEYKQEFLNYMTSQDPECLPGYHVTTTEGSKYTFRRKTDADGLIHIIDLHPSEFKIE